MRLRHLVFLLLGLLVIALPGIGQDSQLIIRQGHMDAINVVKYTPDGRYVISASEDKTIKLWDVNTGIDVKNFSGHPAAVKALAVTSDGQTIISADAEGNIFTWATEGSREPILKIEAHEGAINTLNLFDDNQSILSGGFDQTIKRWDINSGKLIKDLPESMTSEIRAIGIHPNQKMAIVGGQKTNDVELRIIDLETGEVTDDILNHYAASGAAKVYTYAVLSGVSVATSIGKGNIGKDMLDFYIMNYNNIEFRKDGRSALISQNTYLPIAAAKGEEEETGNTVISIAEISEDGSKFMDVKRPERWMLGYSNARAVFSEDQKKIIVNKKYSINVYDMENAEFPEGSYKESATYEPPVLKEFKGDVAWLNSIALSPDYRTAVSSDNENGIKLWDMETGRILRSMEGYVQPALAVDAMPDGKHILVGSLDRELTMWDITTGRLVRTFDRSNDVNWIDIADNGKYFVTTAEKTSFFKVWNFKSGRLLKSILEKDRYFNWAKFSDNDIEIYARSVSTGEGSIGIGMLKSDEELKIWNRQDGKSKKVKDGTVESLEDKYNSNGYQVSWKLDRLELRKGGQTIINDRQAGHLTDATFSKDGKYVITTNAQGEIAMYDIVTGKKTISMALIGNFDYITYTPDYYYTSSKNAAKAIAFRNENTILPFEQLELKYNRPDIIASRLGYASDKLISSYKAAFDKRIKRLGLTEQDLGGKLQLPEVTLDYENLPLATDERSFSFSASATDVSVGLKAIKLFVNDVPVYSSTGREISSSAGESIIHKATIDLSSGINEVKVVAMNKSGLESLPVSFEIKYNAEYAKPTLYLVAIGVSEYRQSNYNLAFAAKDAADMVSTLSGSSGYESIKTKVLTNTDATKANILGLRSFIEQATVDDVVVIFIAGHGVLDNSYNYYFATHDMDFNNPANGGLPYDNIERLIDGIACRNKVLFMDTCHSGELDKDDVADTQKAVVKRGSVAFRSTGTIVQLKENSFGLSNTLELSKTLFGDLKKGTGATIISAAGGTEFAQEGLNSSNGLFTSSLIQGITSRRADIDRNRSYSVSELQRYISEQVTLLSGGSQVPTSREENTKNDFRVY